MFEIRERESFVFDLRGECVFECHIGWFSFVSGSSDGTFGKAKGQTYPVVNTLDFAYLAVEVCCVA